MNDYNERNSYYDYGWSPQNIQVQVPSSLVLVASFQMSHCSGPIRCLRMIRGEGVPFHRQTSQEVLCHGNVPS